MSVLRFRAKYQDLVSECSKVYKKYKNKSGEHSNLHEYDSMADYLEKTGRKVEIWYMFPRMGLDGLHELGKVMNEDMQIPQDVGGKDAQDTFEKNTKRIYS
eukprot:m.149 g.149  ORF g.149 m.149 type:complete len:101 (+) comp50_c0_seq1:148-450(+)